MQMTPYCISVIIKVEKTNWCFSWRGMAGKDVTAVRKQLCLITWGCWFFFFISLTTSQFARSLGVVGIVKGTQWYSFYSLSLISCHMWKYGCRKTMWLFMLPLVFTRGKRAKWLQANKLLYGEKQTYWVISSIYLPFERIT